MAEQRDSGVRLSNVALVLDLVFVDLVLGIENSLTCRMFFATVTSLWRNEHVRDRKEDAAQGIDEIYTNSMSSRYDNILGGDFLVFFL